MKTKVLIVDDSIAVVRQMTKLLESFGGYDVVGHAKNGAEAVKLFKTVKPEIVLMDIIMPMMDGIQSLRTIKKLDPNAKVVMLTALGGVSKKVEDAVRLGALSVISKPIDPEKVRTVLEQIVKIGVGGSDTSFS
ncbi:MAG: response regulator [Deltaproteobacteria bacterium]|nr:response regulator [Deltaproteobacteria bacterium]